MCGGGYDSFSEFVKKHPRFIAKPLSGTLGKNVRIISINDNKEIQKVYNELTLTGSYICEEVIEQDPSLAAFHPLSINTVRIPSVRTDDGVVIFHPFFRMGVGGSVVDNAGSGGIIAPVNAETGIVMMAGIDEMNRQYLTHPDSKIIIPGFQIPHWTELIDMVNELAKIVPDNRYCGWDLALSTNGWVLVEGNARGQFLEQFATKKGVKQELEELIRKISIKN